MTHQFEIANAVEQTKDCRFMTPKLEIKILAYQAAAKLLTPENIQVLSEKLQEIDKMQVVDPIKFGLAAFEDALHEGGLMADTLEAIEIVNSNQNKRMLQIFFGPYDQEFR